MSETLSYALSTLLVAGGAILLYACSSNQTLLRHARRGPLPVLVGTALILAGGAVLMATASACTACLLSGTTGDARTLSAQALMWLTATLWLLVLGTCFLFASARQAWAVLGGGCVLLWGFFLLLRTILS